MASILKIKRKIESLDTDKICLDSLEETKEVMSEFNADQINQGLLADGGIMPDYSRASVEVYGKPEGPIRLRETGAFQSGFYTSIEGDKIVFSSTDPKTNMLVKGEKQGRRIKGGYGKEIFGLNKENKEEYTREALRLMFNFKIKQATGLKIK